jgi:hypothetical protein
MFKPISFPVIRQAMAWEGLKPASLRVLSSFTAPDGIQLADYLATFTREQLADWLPGRDLRNQEPGWYEFRHWLRDCFCSDVQVMGQQFSEDTGRMDVILSIKLTPGARQTTLPGFEEDIAHLNWLID